MSVLGSESCQGGHETPEGQTDRILVLIMTLYLDFAGEMWGSVTLAVVLEVVPASIQNCRRKNATKIFSGAILYITGANSPKLLCIFSAGNDSLYHDFSGEMWVSVTLAVVLEVVPSSIQNCRGKSPTKYYQGLFWYWSQLPQAPVYF